MTLPAVHTNKGVKMYFQISMNTLEKKHKIK
jgi:hypothetical protein